MLPRILIIDDDFALYEPNKKIALKCLALVEKKPQNVPHEKVHTHCLGLATFFSGLVENQFNPKEAVARVKEGWKENSECRWSLVVIDYFFKVNKQAIPGGPMIVRQIKEEVGEDVPIILLSGQEPAKVEQQVGAGVAFLRKPDPKAKNVHETARAFAEILFQNGLYEDGPMRYVDSAGRVQELRSERTFMVGRSLPFLKALREGRQITQRNRDARVLIDAEKGCGKELFAAYLHESAKVAGHYRLNIQEHSRRDNGKLVVVRVGESRDGLAIPDLVGTEQHKSKDAQITKGSIERAEFGTLHFDEISGLKNHEFQLLLRLVEQSSFIRPGDNVAVPVHCQMLFSTNQDIDRLLESGSMPTEFYDRVDRLTIPPVSARGKDKELLFYQFLKEQWNWPHKPKVQEEALEAIENNPWRGNVRQIERVASIIASQGKYRSVIRKDDIELALRKTASAKYTPAVRSLQGLLEGIQSFEVNPDESLEGVVPRIEESIGKLLTKIVEYQYRRSPYRQRLVKTLTGRRMKHHGPATEVNRWIKNLGLDPKNPAVMRLQKEEQEPSGKRQK